MELFERFEEPRESFPICAIPQVRALVRRIITIIYRLAVQLVAFVSASVFAGSGIVAAAPRNTRFGVGLSFTVTNEEVDGLDLSLWQLEWSERLLIVVVRLLSNSRSTPIAWRCWWLATGGEIQFGLAAHNDVVATAIDRISGTDTDHCTGSTIAFAQNFETAYNAPAMAITN